MIVRYFADLSGRYIGAFDGAEPPANSVEVPTAPADARQVWDGSAWLPIPVTMDDFIAALEARYDQEAQTKRYDNRFTCALRAGYPGPFQSQGIAFGSWMDDCNAYAYEQMDLVLAGERPMPTTAELVSELPPMVWP